MHAGLYFLISVHCHPGLPRAPLHLHSDAQPRGPGSHKGSLTYPPPPHAHSPTRGLLFLRLSPFCISFSLALSLAQGF